MESFHSKNVFRHPFLSALFILLLTLYLSFTGSIVYADTFVVSNSLNDGPGSLRTAIASADSYEDVINFDVTGTITLSSELGIYNGLTIQGPGADLLSISGGGVCRVFYIETAESVDISGLSIVSGYAENSAGGGMYNMADNLTVTDCTLNGNAADDTGGGMYNYKSNSTVTNCTFSSNTANYGGGMYNYESSPTVTNCIFSGNVTQDSGGGMRNQNSSPTVTNCTFSSNTASFGGGMTNYYSSSTTIGCTFSSNTATSTGGGMYNYYDYNDSSPTVTNCTFLSNTAETGGGMSNNFSPSPTVTNCTFEENNANWKGGGMCNYESSPLVTNCTFSLNSAYYGSGMSNGDTSGGSGSSPIVKNCIFWDAGGEEIFSASNNEPSTSIPTLSFCIVQRNEVGIGTNSSDIISADPDLESLADNGGPTWTCALGEGSSAIDSGITIAGVSTDQRGTPRPYGDSFDIGAYESGVGFYVITASCSDGGIISPDEAHCLENGNEDETFTLSPNSGYCIYQVYVDEEPVSYDEANCTYTFLNVSANHVISADFQPGEEEGSGGGCNISALPLIGLLLMIPLMFLSRKMK